MEDQQAVIRHHAILIGIDAYPDKPLKSCVQDIQMVKECFATKIHSVNIKTLTASSANFEPIVCSDWPTYRNLASAFEEITAEAKRGDFVYVHYSGHGTRLDPCWDFSNSSTGDLALVLLKGHQSPEIYLRGPRLAGYLKAMVEKGLTVTLVLDCCFSASVYRDDDANARYLQCDPKTTPVRQQDQGEAGADTTNRLANRDTSMRDNWLVDPDQYTILAACGPHESAKGGFLDTGQGGRYGALSRFLYEDLYQYGIDRRHEDIHQRLCARFRECGITQNPVLYGNAAQGFFGRVDTIRSMEIIYIVKQGESLQLLAGQAHGFRDGDRFAISSPTSRNNLDAKESHIARITCAGPLTSKLELLDMQKIAQPGWIARPLTCSYRMMFPVRLASDLPQHDELLEALKDRSIAISIDRTVASFHVVLNNDAYEISDKNDRKLDNLPAMQRSKPDVRRICDILEHLVRYNMAKNLNNKTPATAFSESFNIYMSYGEAVFQAGDPIPVKHNSILKLITKNIGKETLYTYVYNLLPGRWAVKAIFHGTYDAIPCCDEELGFTGTSTKKLKMTVPPAMRKYGSCEDVIKVFITSQPTSFQSIDLPNFDESATTSAGSRISHSVGHGPEDWVALDFLVQTAL